MKKVFRLFIISALLLGLFIPVFDYYFNQEEQINITMAQESRDRNVEELMRLAKESFYQGEYQSAVNYYLEIIEISPFNLESRRNLAVIYNEKNDLFAENEVLLKTAILSGNKQDYLNLAVNFYKLNNNLASNYILENKIDSDFSDSNKEFKKYYYLIKNYLNLKEYNKAEEYLMKITNLKENQAQVYILSAELNRARQNYLQAYQNYNDAYQKDRTQTFLYKEMALMLEKAGEEIKAYNHWQRTLGYGWFRDLAYQKINMYQNKYPQLKPDETDEDEPEEVNPFALEASWREVKEIPEQKENKMLRIGLQENNQHLLFQYSDPFSIIYNSKIIFKGEGKKNYLIEVEDGSIFISSEDNRTKLGDSQIEYQIYSSHQNSSFFVFNINYGQGYFWQGSGNRQYRGNMIIKGENDSFSLFDFCCSFRNLCKLA